MYKSMYKSGDWLKIDPETGDRLGRDSYGPAARCCRTSGSAGLCGKKRMRERERERERASERERGEKHAQRRETRTNVDVEPAHGCVAGVHDTVRLTGTASNTCHATCVRNRPRNHKRPGADCVKRRFF